MATITSFAKGKAATADLPIRTVVTQNKLDFSVTNVTAADVVEAVRVPKGALILNAFVQVLTAEGSAGTADLGDVTDPNGLVAAADINAAGVAKGAGAYLSGKVYAANTVLSVIPSIDLDTAVIKVVVEYAIVED